MITSSKNLRIKQIHKLKKPRERKRSRRFLIEGYREILRAKQGGIFIEELYISEELFIQKKNEYSLIDSLVEKGALLFSLDAPLFSTLSFRDRPDGLLAIAKQKQDQLEEIMWEEDPFLVVAETIEKPGNLGTILRSADAAGVDGVIVADPCTDIHNPNVIRSSVGSIFTQKVVEVDREAAFEFLDKKKIRKVAATPHASQTFTDADLTGPIAILVGSEQYGLSDESLHAADLSVRIPMLGCADSLNVAQATTLLLYEVLRQRHTTS